MENKKQLIIMCGVAGSGKSTWVMNHIDDFKGTTSYVSRDAVRFSMLNDEDDYFAKENEVFNKFIETIKGHLEFADTTIVDATHITIGSRRKLLNALGGSLKDVKIIIMVIKNDLTTILKQNAKREGRAKVPEGTIKSMYKSFIMPTFDEGFDEIWEYGNNRYLIRKKGK